MISFLRPFLAGSIIAIGAIHLSVQDNPENIVIYMEPGEYPAREVIEIINDHNITISYAQTSLRQKPITINRSEIRLNTLLELLFDKAQYFYLMKGQKVLIILKQVSLPENSSGQLNTYDTCELNFASLISCSNTLTNYG